MNIFIITKITKSTRFRRKFQRQYPDQETNLGCPNTETTMMSDSRRVSKPGSTHTNRHDGCKLTPSRSISVDNHDNEILQNNSGVRLETRVPFSKRLEREKMSSGEGKPFLQTEKHPSIEIESATEDEPNEKSTNINNEKKILDNEKVGKEIENPLITALNHAPNGDSENRNRNLAKTSITSTSNYLGISENSSPSTRPSFSEGLARSPSHPDSKSHLTKSGKKNKVQKKHFLKKQQEEHSLGIILIIMSILFIICQSLKIVPDMYEIIVCKSVEDPKNSSEKCTFPPILTKITEISHLLVCINSAANFLIYYCAGGKFREAWLETYGFWWCCCSMKNLKKVVMIPFRRRHNLSTRSSHDASGGDVLSQVVRLSPNRSVQNFKLSPMGKQPQMMPSQNKLTSLDANFESKNHAQPSVESSFVTKVDNGNETRSNKPTYSEV